MCGGRAVGGIPVLTRWAGKSQDAHTGLLGLRDGRGGARGPAALGAVGAGNAPAEGVRRPGAAMRRQLCGGGGEGRKGASEGFVTQTRLWLFLSSMKGHKLSTMAGAAPWWARRATGRGRRAGRMAMAGACCAAARRGRAYATGGAAGAPVSAGRLAAGLVGVPDGTADNFAKPQGRGWGTGCNGTGRVAAGL